MHMRIRGHTHHITDKSNTCSSSLISHTFIHTHFKAFSARSKKLPTRLRDWEAYKQLRQKIEDYQTLLPLLQVCLCLCIHTWMSTTRVCGSIMP